MPPSTKRRNRRKDVELHETPDVDLLDSSPSQRTTNNKRRKINHTPSLPIPEEKTPEPVDAEQPEPDSPGDDADDEDAGTNANKELVNSVVACLEVAEEPVAVMEKYSNVMNRQRGVEMVDAYAKIAGRDWTYYVQSTQINIGRPPTPEQRVDAQSSPVTVAAQSLPEVQIDLGPSKFVSRFHAEILYIHTSPDGWHIRVNGRNGLRLNNRMLKRGMIWPLRCGDVIDIANTQMMFITPDVPATIDPFFVDKSRRLAAGDEWEDTHPEQQARPPLEDVPATKTEPEPEPAGLVAGPSIARQTTPPARQRSTDTAEAPPTKRSPRRRSPLYNRGMMMESTEEIDYNDDANRDVKPPYSYATMIAQVIFASPEEQLTLSGIYDAIKERYAFYRHLQNGGWQNSIRHNLSLNKAFQKVPRRTDEPGKGMKWRILPEHREEYLKKALRKGNPSSAPGSPIGRETPNNRPSSSRGKRGYDRSFENSFPASNASPQQKQPQQQQQTTASPGFSSFTVAPVEAYTPERGSRAHRNVNGLKTVDNVSASAGKDNDDDVKPGLKELNMTDYEEPSPLPPGSRSNTTNTHTNTNTNHNNNNNNNNTNTSTYALSDTITNSPPNPILSSSFLDDTTSSMITPAPRRQRVQLGPPSTARVPSTFMPMSSPAQFWKFADNIGSTPGRAGGGDMSPFL
ncbi:transcription factor [Emmonsiellopsis sp. PD_33]|nr:transcription factor [Emmonsiellopsis sp. PD_33]